MEAAGYGLAKPEGQWFAHAERHFGGGFTNDQRDLDLGNLTHKQTTLFASGIWGALQKALAIHAETVGAEAAMQMRDRLVRDGKNTNITGFSIEDEAASLTALVTSIEFLLEPRSKL